MNTLDKTWSFSETCNFQINVPLEEVTTRLGYIHNDKGVRA